MVENTKIERATHTYNLWWGCQEVSPACDHCYARGIAMRLYPKLSLWAQGSGRLSVLKSEGKQKYLNSPLKWDRIAAERGERQRVFVQSMGDVFDNYRKRALDEEREFLWTMIRKTPNLDWLLLTKRIGNAATMLPADLSRIPNVWLGISVANQEEADRDIPKLLATPARVRFLSCEPLLGPIDLSKYLGTIRYETQLSEGIVAGVDWAIAGGESGPKARPSHPEWFRSLRDQCTAAHVPFHFKQWGEFAPSNLGWDVCTRVGKKSAGRTLDGKVWDQFPEISR